MASLRGGGLAGRTLGGGRGLVVGLAAVLAGLPVGAVRLLHLVSEHREGLPGLGLGGDRLGPAHLAVVDHGQAEGLVVLQHVADQGEQEVDLVMVLACDQDIFCDSVHGEDLPVPLCDGSSGGAAVAGIVKDAGGGVLGRHGFFSWGVGDAIGGL
ncbi:TPA: hypothetical protein DEP34_02475 [Candidatus Uhrbacteria bacterium]|uniref:Uncharacterized protein n=1 Tax=Candidatus Uhrbacteria bacterium GW2011_GWE2_46_68 TaxID=1618994 RepID=A0A0G1SGC3_9BACT|nr:MAG: hypothetical protein UX57_C0006G0013 [Candidatus Uhrbacteria bacterium GW2011_GWE2_46_68]HBK34284.1 hypothetical protein [Candidatus Uhrbacteria bacterium]HCB19229.1 hypothetical protein [Candidatus Uhrbacteria bacterium]